MLEINNEVGFFYQCYKQVKATEFVLQNIRKYFPENPIYIVNDNGINIKDIADKYKCYYVHETENLCKSENLTGWTPEICLKWLNRVLNGVLWCNKKYIINLEDDVICYNKIQKLPLGDINGVYDCPWASNKFSDNFLNFLNLNNIFPKYNYYGACGGFIMESNKFKNIMYNLDLNLLNKLNNLDSRIGNCSDCTITSLFLINGYTYYPWDDLKSKWDERDTKIFAFYHPDKSHYI